jgi:hypothetical protein
VACSTCGGEERCIQGFAGETWRKTRLRWVDNIKLDLQEVEWGAWTRSTWHRIWIAGGLLWMREGNFRFQKRQRISLLVEKVVSFSRMTLFHGDGLDSYVFHIFYRRIQLRSMTWQSHFTTCYFLSHFSTFFPISFQYSFFQIGIRK